MQRSRRHYRLTLIDILAAHRAAIRFGGLDGIRDLGSIEAAIARPYTGVQTRQLYPRIHDKAAALVESIVQNHGFIDGNKRTALLCLGILLDRSGYELHASNQEVEAMLEAVARSEMSFTGIRDWFKPRIASLP